MGKLLEELKHFLSTATPEQLEQAWKEVEQFKDVGPTITEYIDNMKEIEEAYCSFEVSKLLKEKGFDEKCYQKYDRDGYLSFNDVGYINAEKPSEDFGALAPTHQMACAWIRSKGWHIQVNPHYAEGDMRNPCKWRWEIVGLHNINSDVYSDSLYESYEKATEAALMHVLTNLI